MPAARPHATLEQSFAWCRLQTRSRAGNFWFSFLTLPSAARRDMCVLYAFMRECDDIGDDESVSLETRRENLAAWRASLESVLGGGHAEHLVFPALKDMLARRRIPPKYLFDVIDGVRQDLQPFEIATFVDLSNYCYHVAGAVGLCCIHVWGFEDDNAIQPAIDCGTAFQLTNILRDLGEDIARGRVYLPSEDLTTFGYSADDLANHRRDERFRELMRFQVDRAKQYYRNAQALFPQLRPAGRSILAAMMKIYGGVLQEIERRDYDVFTERIRLPRSRKLWIALESLVRHRVLRRTRPGGNPVE